MPTQTSEATTSELPLDPTSEVGDEQPEKEDDDDYGSREFIADSRKRKKRFNTYKTRINTMLQHLGSACGTFGFLYLRSPYHSASMANMKG